MFIHSYLLAKESEKWNITYQESSEVSRICLRTCVEDATPAKDPSTSQSLRMQGKVDDVLFGLERPHEACVQDGSGSSGSHFIHADCGMSRSFRCEFFVCADEKSPTSDRKRAREEQVFIIETKDTDFRHFKFKLSHVYGKQGAR